MNKKQANKFSQILVEAFKLLAILLIPIFCYLSLIGISSTIFLQHSDSQLLSTLIPLISACIFFLILSLLYLKKGKEQWKKWGITEKINIKYFLHFSLIATGIIIISALIIILLGGGEIDILGAKTVSLIPAISFFIFVAAVEEFSFRMFIFHFMNKRFNFITSILITNILFSIYHLLTPGISILPLFNLFLIGILFSLAYVKTKSIFIPIAMHFFWNFIQGPILGFDVSGLVFDNIFKFENKGMSIINGGNYGLEGSIITTVLLLITSIILWKKRKSETITSKNAKFHFLDKK
ncbi:MAG: lysostaphin resistance A-like protein [Bacteroidales bacterium]